MLVAPGGEHSRLLARSEGVRYTLPAEVYDHAARSVRLVRSRAGE
jgi:hypothetical protein